MCLRRAVLVLLSVVLIVSVLGVPAYAEETKSDANARKYLGDTIEIDGVTYSRKPNITTVLLMGIDKLSDMEVDGYRGTGQADFLRLVVINDENDTISMIPIDRDTITEVKVLNIMGRVSGTRTMQICLSHGFGDGKGESCGLTCDAVSGLMYGITIDKYASLTMDGINVLNDWVGGIEVTLEDDLSEADPAMVKGATLTLVGSQAETYVRSRHSAGIKTNEARMKRQQQFITKLTDKLKDIISNDKNSISELYETLKPYMVTDMTKGSIINLVWASKDYESVTYQITGEHYVADDGYMHFDADYESIKQIVLELMYEPIE